MTELYKFREQRQRAFNELKGHYSREMFTKQYGESDRPAQQRWLEFKMLFELVMRLNPKYILEIGQMYGGTLYYWLQSTCVRIVGLDITHENLIPFDDNRLQLITMDSVLAVDTVKSILPEINFLFIDGDHSYKGVKSDYELYSPLVKNGIIALHDINEGKDQKQYGWGTSRFWKELKQKEQTEEFVEKRGAKTSFGIGVVYKM
jgi:cephalosporin hydroxylase